MSELTDLQKLQFYRDEIRTEFNMIAMRSTILVTCQSFLVVPFGIIQPAQSYPAVAVYAYIIAALGIFTSFILIRPLDAAHRTIDSWFIKQRSLLKASTELSELVIDRDRIPGADTDPSKDRIHKRSLAFSVYGPWAFIIFWILMCAWSTVRLVVGF